MREDFFPKLLKIGQILITGFFSQIYKQQHNTNRFSPWQYSIGKSIGNCSGYNNI